MTSTTPPSALLEVRDVHKSYGGAVALRAAHLTLHGPGRVHCLAGENGSGKSTLLGIISGNVRPDTGQVLVAGQATTFRTPHDALRHGIAMVSQETTIAPELTVTENVLLGHRLVRSRFGIDWKASRKKAAEILALLDLDYNLNLRVGKLAAHQRQMTEIARALSMDSQILILDEPTSSLTDDDASNLFAAMRRLTTRGVTVIFVSHRLPEVFAICDDVTVLRDGVTVHEGPVADIDADALVAAMVGDSQRQQLTTRSTQSNRQDEPSVLSVERLCVPGVLHDVSLHVTRGEIVGLTGLVASGRSELLESVFGLRTPEHGTLSVAGHPYTPTSPRNAMKAGLGYLPPDRKTQGLVLNMSIRDNLALAATSRAAALKRPDRRRQEAIWKDAMTTMRIRASSPSAAVGSLSGGNQQKVALAKWLACKPAALLLDEPTRGVDVGAKADIYSWLKGTATTDIGIVVSSSEYEELLKLCDRIMVMARGRVVAEVAASDTSEERLAALAGGHV